MRGLPPIILVTWGIAHCSRRSRRKYRFDSRTRAIIASNVAVERAVDEQKRELRRLSREATA